MLNVFFLIFEIGITFFKHPTTTYINNASLKKLTILVTSKFLLYLNFILFYINFILLI